MATRGGRPQRLAPGRAALRWELTESWRSVGFGASSDGKRDGNLSEQLAFVCLSHRGLGPPLLWPNGCGRSPKGPDTSAETRHHAGRWGGYRLSFGRDLGDGGRRGGRGGGLVPPATRELALGLPEASAVGGPAAPPGPPGSCLCLGEQFALGRQMGTGDSLQGSKRHPPFLTPHPPFGPGAQQASHCPPPKGLPSQRGSKPKLPDSDPDTTGLFARMDSFGGVCVTSR